MPGRRFGRRFNGRRKKRFGARRSYKRIARIAKRVIIKNTEVKRQLITGTQNISGTQQLINITPAIAQGTDKNDRIGNKVMFRFLTLKINAFAVGAAGAPQIAVARIGLMTSRKSALTAVDVNEEGISAIPTVQTISMPFRSEVCNVLKDKQYIHPGAGTGLLDSSIFNIPTARIFKFSRKIPRTAKYESSVTTGPAEPHSNIYIYLANTNANCTTTFSWSGRLSYIDL